MRRWSAAAALLAVLVAGCAGLPPADGPEPAPPPARDAPAAPAAPSAPAAPAIPLAGFPSVRVSGGSEPMVLADRAGRFVWIGDTSGGYRTTSNGTRWDPFGGYPANFAVAFNDGWALAQDGAGSLYVAVLQDNRVDVLRSRDGGVAFDQFGYAAGVSGTADRPWLAAKEDGTVALFYFDAPTVLLGLSEHCARSTDGGLTFTDRDPAAVLPGQGGSAFYDSDGRLYFSSNTGSLFRFDSTCLAGSTSIPMGADLGVNNMIQSAADGTDLYMAAATDGSKAITLFGLRGGGAAKRLVVSPPELHSNTYAAVAARGGKVAVAWYGSPSAGDPSAATFAGEFDTYLTVVTDFWDGPRTATSRLTAAPNHRGTICMGGASCDPATISGCGTRCLLDYMGVAIDAWGGVHVAYVDDTSGDSQVNYVHVPPARPPPPPPGAQPPTADFTVRVQDRRASVDAGRSSSPSGSVLKYRWAWGDGAAGTGRTAEHEYAQYGTYTITLTVTDAAGRTGSQATRIRVDGRSVGPPDAAWTMEPEEPVAGQPVEFRDASHAMAGAALVAWRWDFGDGGTAEEPAATHAFADPGTYAVALEVQDDHGGLDALSRDVVVAAATDGEPSASDGPAQRSPAGAALAAAAATLAAAWLARRQR